MKYLWTIVIVLFTCAVGAVLYAWSGRYNIAATEPHWGVTLAFIETLRDRSVSVHSEDIRVPNLNGPKLKEAAFSHFHAMCRLCHGAPGFPPEEFAEGLYPAPPKMIAGHIQEEFGDAELYWIIKHGLKMTGMPASGPTHNEEELWGLAALVKEMPEMTPEQYLRQIKAPGPEREAEHGHEDASTLSEADKNHH